MLFFNDIRLIGFVVLTLVICFTGCTSPDEYKEQADEEVYSILDQKWLDDFGPKANYKITDEPNSLEAIHMIPPSGMLTLKEAVGMAIRFNRNYQSDKENLYLSALRLTETRYEYAPQWFGTVRTGYSYVGTAADEEATDLEADVGVNQQILIGDTMLITASLSTEWTRFLTGDPQTSLSSVLRSSLTAPLWGVGAARLAREDLTQAERDVLYAIRSFAFERRDFVIGIISSYYSVLQQQSSVDIQKASYERLIDSTDRLRMEVEVGQEAAYNLGEAEQSLLTAEQNVVDRIQSYEQALDSFKIQLALPTDIDVQLDPNELNTLSDIGISKPDFTAEDAIQLALASRLDLANARDELDDAERQLILAADGLGPQVELALDATVNSTPETQLTRLRFHEGAYSADILMDLPLDRLEERNAYRRTLITVQRRQRSYDEFIDNIKLQVRDSYRTLIQSAESYRIQKIGMELAQKRVEAERLSLQYGRGTVRLLLDSEDALVQAQDDVLGALVNHQIAKLNFFQNVGLLRVRPDGMLEQVKP